MSLSTGLEISMKRKRKASSRITDENFVGAESNAVTKRLKLSAEKQAASSSMQAEVTAQRKGKASSSITDENGVGGVIKQSARAVKHRQTHSSVEEVEEEDTIVNVSPKNANAVLEAADGSDDVAMLGVNDLAAALQPSQESDDEEGQAEGTEPVETAEEQRGESNTLL
jgi:hypothetical protein